MSKLAQLGAKLEAAKRALDALPREKFDLEDPEAARLVYEVVDAQDAVWEEKAWERLAARQAQQKK